MRKSGKEIIPFLLWALVLGLASCQVRFADRVATPIVNPATIQVTIYPSRTSSPSPTNAPPTATPIPGHTITSVYVRSGPNTTSPSLGLLAANQEVQILGRNEQGDWYLISYPSAERGVGWVSAQYLQAGKADAIPILASPTLPSLGPIGRVTQRLNVRSGPGLSFEVIGILEAETIVTLTGRNQNSSWLQILYPQGPNGRGWVSVAYLQAEEVGSLPILDEFGTPFPPSTGPTARPMTPTPTIGPAFFDRDSHSSPAAKVIFSPSGPRSFSYSSDLSVPEGDSVDWIEFVPYATIGNRSRLSVSLSCYGNGDIEATLWSTGEQINGVENLSCHSLSVDLILTAGQSYLLRLNPQMSSYLVYVSYTLTIQNEP